MTTETTVVQTRLPIFMWEALKDSFYEFDAQFLRDVAPLVGVPVTELKAKILGARGALTNTVVLASDTAWWERELCPLFVCTGNVWRGCGQPREPHGTCARHQFWKMMRDPHVCERADLTEPLRLPKSWRGENVWVSPTTNDACREDGEIIKGLRICAKSGILLEEPAD